MTVGLSSQASHLLERMSEGQALAGGRNVAQSLCRLLPLVSPLLDPAEARTIAELADYLARQGTWRLAPGQRGQASWGAGAGVWGALISNRIPDSNEPPDESDLVLGLFVVRLLRLTVTESLTVTDGYVNDVGALARKLLINDSARELVRCILGTPSSVIDMRALAAARAVLSRMTRKVCAKRLGSDASCAVLQRLIDELISSQSTRRPPKPGSGKPATRTHERFTRPAYELSTFVAPAPGADRAARHPADERPVVTTLQGQQRGGETQRAARRRLYVAHQNRIDGLFFEFSNGSLSLPEARAAATRLWTMLANGTPGDHCYAGVLALVLQGLTGRDLAAVVRYELSPVHPRHENEIGADGRLLVPVPGGLTMWKPALHGSTLPQAAIVTQITLPHVVAETISKLGHSRLLFDDPEAATASALQVAKMLRRSVVSRFALDRWRTVLPLCVERVTGDPRLAQIVCGDRLGLSDSPLYYKAYRESEVQVAYRSAIQLWFPALKPGSEVAKNGAEGWVGSSLGAASDEQVRLWVAALRPQRAVGDYRRLDELLEAASDLARWTGWMFCAASGFRHNRSIAAIRLSEIDLDAGFAIVTDKVGDQAELARPVAIGEKCVTQIRALMAVYSRVLRQLPRRHSPKRVPYLPPGQLAQMREHLHLALSGSGPLFFPVNGHQRKSTPVGEWMMEPWSAMRLPSNAMRHVLATHWLDCGGTQLDLYAQMGHSLGAGQHFGSEATRTVLEFVRSAGPVVDRILDRFAWTVIQPEGLHTSHQALLSCKKILRRQVRFQENLQCIGRSDAKATRSTVARVRRIAKDCIADWLRKNPPVEGRPPLVTEADRASLVDELRCRASEAGVHAERQFLEASICKRIRVGRRAGQLESGPLPILHRVQREASKVAPAALNAHMLVSRLRMQVMEQIASLTRIKTICGHHASDSAAYFRFYVLCLLYLPVSRMEDIHRLVMSARSSLYLDAQGGCLLEIREGQCVAVPQWIALTIQPLRSGSAPAPPTSQLESWLGEVLGSCQCLSRASLIPSAKDILELVALAARIEVPGVLWPTVPEQTPNREMDAERTVAFLSGISGAGRAAVPPRQGAAPQRVQERPPAHAGSGVGASAARTRATVKRALRLEEEIDRSVFQQNVVLALPNKRRRTIRDAVGELQGAFDDLEARPWEYGIAEAASLYFVRDLLADDANLKTEGPLQLSTVSSYYGIVRDHVIPRLAEHRPEYADRDEWIEIYMRVYGELNTDSRDRGSNAMRRFHDTVSRELGIEPIASADWPWPTSGVVTGQRFGGVVASHEHQSVLNVLGSWAQEARSEARSLDSDYRLLQIARLVWSLLWNLGMRSLSEAMSLRHSDIDLLDDGSVIVCMRRSGVAGLKSQAAYRAIPADRMMAKAEIDALRSWIRDERQSAGQARNRQTYLFPDLQVAGDASTSWVLQLIQIAIRSATGRDEARPHWGRHSFATRTLFDALKIPYVGDRTPGPAPSLSATGALRVIIGHTAIETTIGTYAHVYHLRHLVLQSPSLTDKTLAGLMGRHAASLSRTRQSIDAPDQQGLTRVLLEHWRPTAPAHEPTPPARPKRRHEDPGIQAIGRMLHILWHGGGWDIATWRLGLSAEQQHAMMLAVMRMGIQLPDCEIPLSLLDKPATRLGVVSPRVYRHTAASGLPGAPRRRLPEFAMCCQHLDARYAASPRTWASDAGMVRAVLGSSGFIARAGAIYVQDRTDLEALVLLLEGATKGVKDLDVGVATVVATGDAQRRTIREYLATMGLARLPVVVRSTTGSESVPALRIGVCLVRTSTTGSGDPVVAGAILAALLAALITRDIYRQLADA